MNREQLISHVKAQTGKHLFPEQISEYISWGILTPDTSRPGAAHHYPVAEAYKLICYIQALTIADTANEMSRRLGWHIRTKQIRSMCEAREIIHIATPRDYKIPLNSLDLLENKLRLMQEQRIEPEYSQLAIEHCLELMTMTELVARCDKNGHTISLSMMSRIYTGKRRMKNRLYNFLLTIPRKEL